MVATLTQKKPPVSRNGGDGGNHGDSGGGKFSDSGGWASERAAQIGLLFFLATITMLFAGLTSAFIIRRASSDWQPIYFSSFLWLSTSLILSSSITLEISRMALRTNHHENFRFWLTITAMLGFGFLFSQVMVWRDLASHGIFLPSNPHSSFFYLLTGLHGLHLLGGLVVLFWVTFRAWTLPFEKFRPFSVKLAAIYWHFLDMLWIYLLYLLFIA